jgi:TRAP-type C4-dicarboxylate transport system permease small subunit
VSLKAGFLAFERRLTDGVMAAAAACLAVCVLAGFWQVISRFVLSEPATWSEALIRTLLIWMAFLGLGGAFRAGALVSIDLCHRVTRGKVRLAVELIILSSSLFTLVVLVIQGWKMAERVKFQNLAGLEVSIAWGYAAIPVGAAFAFFGVLANFLDRRAEDLETAV